jgi:hypothetical protein
LAADFDKSKGDEARGFNWQDFEDEQLKREFAKIVDIGYAVLAQPQYRRVSYLRVHESNNPIICYI